MLNQETETDWRGSVLPVPVVYGANQGVSGTFSNAQGNLSGIAGASFQLTRAQLYGVSQIDRLTMIASDAAPDDAWLKARLAEVDETRNQILNELEFQLFGDGSGNRGQIISTANVATTTVGLADAQSAVRFFVNQTLVASPNANGSSPRSGSAVVSGVDRNGGNLTFATALNTQIPSVAASDYLFLQGSVGPTLSVTGLAGYLPLTAPTSSDNFLSMNRSIDSGLFGTIYDGSAEEIQEALIDGIQAIERIGGGKPDVCFLNNYQFAKLRKSMGTQVRYVDVAANAVEGVSFKAIELYGSNGPIAVMADRMCSSTQAYVMQSDDWSIMSTGEVPDLVDEDGVTLLRVYNADAFEIRQAFYGNLRCRAPAHSGVVKLQNP